MWVVFVDGCCPYFEGCPLIKNQQFDLQSEIHGIKSVLWFVVQ